MKIETKYNIDDRVEIGELGRTGSITSISYDGVRIRYMIRYFDNSCQQSATFYDDEIKKVEK